jgi:hypothetical protein
LLTVREYFKKRNYHRAGNCKQPKQMPFGKAWNGIGTKERKCFILALVTYYGWEMNFKLEGYSRCLITYVMGARFANASNSSRHHQGWARNWSNSKWWVAVWLKRRTENT